MRTALLYLANIPGSASDSEITGFVLMDRMGLVTVGATLVESLTVVEINRDTVGEENLTSRSWIVQSNYP